MAETATQTYSETRPTSEPSFASNTSHGRSDKYCCVPQCNGNGRIHPNLSFHRFPTPGGDNKLRGDWIKAIRRDPGPFFTITSSTYVCSRHFLAKDFKWTPVKKTLKPGTVPSVFHWIPNFKPSRRKILRASDPTDLHDHSNEKIQSPVKPTDVNTQSHENPSLISMLQAQTTTANATEIEMEHKMFRRKSKAPWAKKKQKRLHPDFDDSPLALLSTVAAGMQRHTYNTPSTCTSVWYNTDHDHKYTKSSRLRLDQPQQKAIGTFISSIENNHQFSCNTVEFTAMNSNSNHFKEEIPYNKAIDQDEIQKNQDV